MNCTWKIYMEFILSGPFQHNHLPKPEHMTAEQNLQPITSKERINSLDIIRGIALFGILLMNIKARMKV